MSLCPCCRQELPRSPNLVVSLDSNTAVARGHFIELQPDQAVVAHELVKAWPHCLTHERIYHALWGSTAPLTAETSMRVHITRLRRALGPLGYGIVVVWGDGYRLVDQGRPATLVGQNDQSQGLCVP